TLAVCGENSDEAEALGIGRPRGRANGFLPIRYGQSGQPLTVHLATSLGWSQQQSRHFARITFNSGPPLWPACSSSSRPRRRGSAPAFEPSELRMTGINRLLFRGPLGKLHARSEDDKGSCF